MSARVFNPHIMSEMRRVLRGGGHLDLSESDVRSPRDNNSLERIKKCLFGPIDHNECKMYVQQEMESHRDKASEKWNFDFKTGKPRPLEEGCVYEWKVMKTNEPVPEAYALARLPYLSQHADNSTTVKVDPKDSQSCCPSSSSSVTSAKRTVKCNKQTVITGKFHYIQVLLSPIAVLCNCFI